MIKPFLKWAGGKRWLIQNYPKFIPTQFNRYIEPFLGSGAVFFYIRPSMSLLSDTNAELINAYQALKDDWKRVHRILQVHQQRHGKLYYYRVRESRPRNKYARAARLIYLNRTCWNGLYRVNLLGQFNVPKGTKNTVVLDTDDFELISLSLKNSEIKVADFENTIETAQRGDFLFVDPPYTVKHGNNGFVKYNENLFHWDDQLRLHKCLDEARKRGAIIVLTNACHASIKKLYQDSFEISVAHRNSVIAADSRHRRISEEYIIRST